MAFLLQAMCEEDVFVDVGANVGSYTILACAAVGARGYAFEPVPSTHSRLVENLRLNHLEARVIHPNIGIGEKIGRLVFTSGEDTVNHALAAGEISTDTVDVEISTLDALLSGESPSFMKIDVEGFETPVLKGAEQTLAKSSLNSVIMELNGSGDRYGYDETNILELMFDHGFRTYSYDPLGRVFGDLAGKNLQSGNTLFIRDLASVKERVRQSAKIAVNGELF